MKRCLVVLAAGLALAARGEESSLVNLTGAGRLVARYQAAPSPKKPYIKELFTPSGVQVLLDSPSDHVHHHGVMFAVGAGGTDFWSEKPAERFGAQVPVPGSGLVEPTRIRQALNWTTPAGGVVLTEARQVTALDRPGAGPNLLTWRTELTAPAGGAPVQLTGSHYFGLGMRFIPDLNGNVEFLYADRATGTVYRGEERLTTARWSAARGQVGGKPVTVAMFDSPKNPRHPAVWFTMPRAFAYLSATLGLEKTPLTLDPGKSLLCTYGVAIWDGLVDAAAIDAACAQWVAAEGH